MEMKRFFSPIYLNFIAIYNYLFVTPYRYLLHYGYKNLFHFLLLIHTSVYLCYTLV